jgi:GTPase SAR1 family protein
MVCSHYQGAHGALLVFDLSDLNSFVRAKQWIAELSDNTPESCKMALVTNKCDLPEDMHQVDETAVRVFAHQNSLLYYETSSFWNRDDDETKT